MIDCFVPAASSVTITARVSPSISVASLLTCTSMPYQATTHSSSVLKTGTPNIAGVGSTRTTRMSASTPCRRQWSAAR